MPTATRYRFGTFELDTGTAELRRNGLRIKLHQQPFQMLVLLLERPGEIVAREQITQALWPDGTFVDYEHGVNSALNRLREALGDTARNPRFVETIPRRGYRFLAPVERLGDELAEPVVPAVPEPDEPEPDAPELSPAGTGLLDRVLATPEDLPRTPVQTARLLYLALQLMYLGFYIGALSNLGEIHELLAAMSLPTAAFVVVMVSSAVLIPPRTFLATAVLFRPPGLRHKLLTVWLWLLPFDLLWALAPFLLLHHIAFGFALACCAFLVYSPFAQRSLILMGAGSERAGPLQ